MSHDVSAHVITPSQASGLINAQRYAEAIALLTTAVTNQPQDAEIQYLLGTAHLRGGYPLAARAAFAATIRAVPRHAYAHYGLGLIAKDSGDPAAAARHFQDALDADPQLAPARRHLAELRGGEPTVSAADAPPAPAAHSLAEILDVRDRPRLDEEQMAGAIVWSGRPAIRFMAGSLILAIGFLLLPGFLSETAEGMAPSAGRDGLAALWRLAEAVSWPAALVLIVTGYVRVATRRYVIREHRTDVFAGIINRQHTTIWLHDVERPVIVRQNLWQLALGIASVEIDSTVLRAPRGRRQVGRPGRLLLSGLPIGFAEDAAGFLRTAVLWERRRMVLTFVSVR